MMNWDTTFTVTIDGCLKVAEIAARPKPKPLSRPALCPASCLRCKIANIYGPPSCFGTDCPNPVGGKTEVQTDAA